MTTEILKCTSCGSYGMNNKCPCGSGRKKCNPPKFNPNDKYSKYRAKYKKKEGIL